MKIHHMPGYITIVAFLLAIGIGVAAPMGEVLAQEEPPIIIIILPDLVDLSITADLSSGLISTLTDVNGITGERYTSAYIPINPFTLYASSAVHLHLSFLPNQYLQLTSGQYNFSQEYMGFSFLNPQPWGAAMTEETRLTSISGTSGDMIATLPLINVGTGTLNGSSASGLSIANFTDTSFSFTGWDMYTMFLQIEGPVTVSGINFFAVATNVAVFPASVPEPFLLHMLGVGAAALFLMRKTMS
jgi:hypothetical protein